MADQSDVESAVAALAAAALYPAGVPARGLSALGCVARIGRGWPNQKALDADLAAGVLNLSVYPRPGSERVTTRFPAQWVVAPAPPATFQLAQAGQQISVSGVQPQPFYVQNLCILVGGVAVLHLTDPSDTPTSIAAALAAELANLAPEVTATGPSITLPPEAVVTALRVGTTGTMSREVARQQRQFQIVLWCFDPAVRDGAAALLKPAFDSIEFLSLGDGSQARLQYALSTEDDAPEKAILYRRDLIYWVEWATFETADVAEIVAGGVFASEGGCGPSEPITSDEQPVEIAPSGADLTSPALGQSEIANLNV